jgi:hypothetical protein
MAEVREVAQKLVHRVAEGGEIPTALLHNFADVVLRSELIGAANRLLDAPPTFAVRRAMDLAALVLSIGASESGPIGEGHESDPTVRVRPGKGS